MTDLHDARTQGDAGADVADAAPHPITLTLFAGQYATTPERVDDFDDFEELADALEDLIELEAEDKGSLWAIAPYRLKPGTTRGNDNVEAVTLLALDVDRCNVYEVGAALEELGVNAVMYGSPSDDPTAPADATDRRVRVLVEPDRELTPAECGPARERLAELLGLGPDSGVKEAREPARLFFCGTLEGTAPRLFWRFGGADE